MHEHVAPNPRDLLPDISTNAVVLQALVKMAEEASDSAEVTSWAVAFFAVEKEHTQCLIMLGGAARVFHCSCLRCSVSEHAQLRGAR